MHKSFLDCTVNMVNHFNALLFITVHIDRFVYNAEKALSLNGLHLHRMIASSNKVWHEDLLDS